MGEIKRIDPTGMAPKQRDKALFDLMHQVHDCLETHIAETRLAHLTASEAREKLAGKVEGISAAVGSLETRQSITEGSVSALAKALGAEVPKGAKPVAIDAPMRWKDVGKVVLGVVSAMGGIVLLLQILAPGVAATWEAIMRANT